MKVVIFEDDDCHQLYPLTFLRPVFELRCGALSLREKVQERFPDSEIHLEVRQAIAEVAGDTYGAGALNNPERLEPDDDFLVLNAAVILTGPADSYREAEKVAVSAEDEFLWAYLQAETAAELAAETAGDLAARALQELPTEETADLLLRHPWDLVAHNPEQITADFEAAYASRERPGALEKVAILGESADLYVAEEADLQPFTVLDCRSGPVIIETGARIGAHSAVAGPAFIGPEAVLEGARVRGGSSIGPSSRIAGTVEQSILQACCRQQSGGYLGHSYLGAWVSLGAGTVTADARIDADTVTAPADGSAIDTGMAQVGAFIGDYTRTGVGTLLNAGTVAGIMCRLVPGPSLLPKRIPSFAWHVGGRMNAGLGLSRALDAARADVARQGAELGEAMIKLLKDVEQSTRPERTRSIRRSRRRKPG